MEMPTQCACGDVVELNDMWSTPDFGVECSACHRKREVES